MLRELPSLEVLRAFSSSQSVTALTEIYTSIKSVITTNIGKVNAFPTPTIFKGQVYMGTQTEVDVFGPCSTNGSSGCLH